MKDSLDNLLADVENDDDLLSPEEVDSMLQQEHGEALNSAESYNISDDIYSASAEKTDTSTQPEDLSAEHFEDDTVSSSDPLPEQEEPAQNNETEKDNTRFLCAAPGSKEWNSGPPYIIPVNNDLLLQEDLRLNRVFFTTQSPLSGAVANDEINKALIGYMRKADPDLKETCLNFYYHELLTVLQEISSLFKLSEITSREFLYHIGSLTVLKCLIVKLKFEKKGDCYYYSGNGKGARFFPEETIKSIVMDWFRENIFSSAIDFNSLPQFDMVKRIIISQYKIDRKHFNGLLERVNLKAGPERALTAERFLMLKGNDIIGAIKLNIYRRFLGSSIFR